MNSEPLSMNIIRVIFFGSTSDSLIVVKHLLTMNHEPLTINLVAIVTQPPRPVGRKQILTPTPVESWGRSHNITILSFPNSPDHPYLYTDEQTVIDTLAPLKADLLVSACYGQKIPSITIKGAKLGGLNVHPSLLPRWRGADPVPWAILSGDHQTGVTIGTLEEKFDQGKILAQKKIPILDTDFSDPLRTKLFALGAELLTETLPNYLSGKNKGKPQNLLNHEPLTKNHKPSYARRLTREDGFIPWEMFKSAMNGVEIPLDKRPGILIFSIGHLASSIARVFRALSPWPGLWTKINLQINKSTNDKWEEKRLKILSCHLSSNNLTMKQFNNFLVLDSVQLEGKKPVPFKEFAKAYLPKMI